MLGRQKGFYTRSPFLNVRPVTEARIGMPTVASVNKPQVFKSQVIKLK